MNDAAERTLAVIAAEEEKGSTEYKRQLCSPSASRLRSLATQMSYRLDEGMGRCTYQIGVEDDGCHSLLSYASVAESARIVECIARSLNAVVLERLMIQGEVVAEKSGDGASDTSRFILSSSKEDLTVVEEPSILGDGSQLDGAEGGDFPPADDEKEEKIGENGSTNFNGTDASRGEDVIRIGRRPLIKDDNISGPESFTRCELTIQRIETHLLDPTPLSLASIARGQRQSQAPTNTGISSSMVMTVLLLVSLMLETDLSRPYRMVWLVPRSLRI